MNDSPNDSPKPTTTNVIKPDAERSVTTTNVIKPDAERSRGFDLLACVVTLLTIMIIDGATLATFWRWFAVPMGAHPMPLGVGIGAMGTILYIKMKAKPGPDPTPVPFWTDMATIADNAGNLVARAVSMSLVVLAVVYPAHWLV